MTLPLILVAKFHAPSNKYIQANREILLLLPLDSQSVVAYLVSAAVMRDTQIRHLSAASSRPLVSRSRRAAVLFSTRTEEDNGQMIQRSEDVKIKLSQYMSMS